MHKGWRASKETTCDLKHRLQAEVRCWLSLTRPNDMEGCADKAKNKYTYALKGESSQVKTKHDVRQTQAYLPRTGFEMHVRGAIPYVVTPQLLLRNWMCLSPKYQTTIYRMMSFICKEVLKFFEVRPKI